MKNNFINLGLVLILCVGLFQIPQFFEDMKVETMMDSFIIVANEIESDEDLLDSEKFEVYFIDNGSLQEAIDNKTIKITNYACQDSDFSNKYEDYTLIRDENIVTVEVDCNGSIKNAVVELVYTGAQYKISKISK